MCIHVCRNDLIFLILMKNFNKMLSNVMKQLSCISASLLQQGLVARYQIEDSNNEIRSPDTPEGDPISEFEMLERNLMAGKMKSTKPDFNSLSKNFHSIDVSSPEMQQKMDFMKIQAQVGVLFLKIYDLICVKFVKFKYGLVKV